MSASHVRQPEDPPASIPGNACHRHTVIYTAQIGWLALSIPDGFDHHLIVEIWRVPDPRRVMAATLSRLFIFWPHRAATFHTTDTPGSPAVSGAAREPRPPPRALALGLHPL